MVIVNVTNYTFLKQKINLACVDSNYDESFNFEYIFKINKCILIIKLKYIYNFYITRSIKIIKIYGE